MLTFEWSVQFPIFIVILNVQSLLACKIYARAQHFNNLHELEIADPDCWKSIDSEHIWSLYESTSRVNISSMKEKGGLNENRIFFRINL